MRTGKSNLSENDPRTPMISQYYRMMRMSHDSATKGGFYYAGMQATVPIRDHPCLIRSTITGKIVLQICHEQPICFFCGRI